MHTFAKGKPDLLKTGKHARSGLKGPAYNSEFNT